MGGYDLTPTMKDIQRKFSVRYFLNLVLIDEEERRYFKQQVNLLLSFLFFLIKKKFFVYRKLYFGENKIKLSLKILLNNMHILNQ